MGNEQKLENLRHLIKTSVTLSVQEKEEWLELVELMNDKQMSELMELLGQKEEALNPPKTPPVTEGLEGVKDIRLTDPAVARLSHISNLPSGVLKTQPQEDQLLESRATAASRIVSIPAKSSVSLNASTTAGMTTSVQTNSNIDIPATRSNQSTNNPAASISAHPSNPLNIQLPSEASTLTVEILRKEGVDSMANALRNLAAIHGYFAVLDNFEHSPLYTAYLQAGQRMLSGNQKMSENELSAQEFEMITDLMSSLRINRF